MKKKPLQIWEELHCRPSGSADSNDNNVRLYGSSWEPSPTVTPPVMEHDYCAQEGGLFRFQHIFYYHQHLYDDNDNIYHYDSGNSNPKGDDIQNSKLRLTTTTSLPAPWHWQQQQTNGLHVMCCDEPQQERLDIPTSSLPSFTNISPARLRRDLRGPTKAILLMGISEAPQTSIPTIAPIPSGMYGDAAVVTTPQSPSPTTAPIPALIAAAAATAPPSPILTVSPIQVVVGTAAAATAPPDMFKWRVDLQVVLSSISCVMLVILVAAISLPLLRKDRRTKASTYNLYLVFLSIPDLIYNAFLVYLFATFDEWTMSANSGGGDEATFPLIDHHIDLALFAACVSTSLYMNAVVSHEILKLLRKSKRRQRCNAPSLQQATLQAGCTYAIGILVFMWDHFLTDALKKRLPLYVWYAFNILLTMGLPIIYMTWVSVRIYWEGLVYNIKSPSGERLIVLVKYFARIIIVYILLWIPIAILYLQKVNENGDQGIRYYQGCLLFALQVWVSFGFALTKPDVRKAVVRLLYCGCCQVDEHKSQAATSMFSPSPSAFNFPSSLFASISDALSISNKTAETIPGASNKTAKISETNSKQPTRVTLEDDDKNGEEKSEKVEDDDKCTPPTNSPATSDEQVDENTFNFDDSMDLSDRDHSLHFFRVPFRSSRQNLQ